MAKQSLIVDNTGSDLGIPKERFDLTFLFAHAVDIGSGPSPKMWTVNNVPDTELPDIIRASRVMGIEIVLGEGHSVLIPPNNIIGVEVRKLTDK